MTRTQGALTVVTPIAEGQAESLRSLLTDIGNDVERNALVPFARMKTVHFARWVVLPERRSEVAGGSFPAQLVLSTSYDGPLDEHVADLLGVAGGGFDAVYSHCLYYPDPATARPADVAAYLLSHAIDASIFYVGAPGVSVKRVLEEMRLRDSIEEFLDRGGSGNGHWASASAADVRDAVRLHVASDESLQLGPLAPRVLSLPWYGWAVLVLLGILLSPAIILAAVLIRLREMGDARREATLEPFHAEATAEAGRAPDALATAAVPVDPRRQALHANIRAVTEREDHQFQNQLSHVVELRPGWLRRTVLAAILPVLNFAAQRIYNQGNLIGVSTLHFVRWVLIDDGRRLMFLTNYDGSMISYVGDFVNRSWQVPSVLTAIWSNTLRFPPTRFLVLDGVRDAVAFTAFLREHQVETQVWYSAYKDVTVGNKVNNDWIRRGLSSRMDEAGTRKWLSRL